MLHGSNSKNSTDASSGRRKIKKPDWHLMLGNQDARFNDQKGYTEGLPMSQKGSDPTAVQQDMSQGKQCSGLFTEAILV